MFTALLIALLQAPAAVDAGAEPHVPPIEAIRAVRVDVDGDGVPDRMGDTVRIAGRASLDSDRLNRNYTFLFMQDDDAGIALFSYERFAPVLAGDSIVVTGVVHQYRGLAQLQLIDIAVVAAPQRVPQPLRIDDLSGDLERYEGMLVQVRGHVKSSVGSEIGRYAIVGADTALRGLGVFISGAHANPPDLAGLGVGDQVVLTGLLGQHDYSEPYGEDYQIFPRSPEDVRVEGLSRAQVELIVIWGAVALGIVLLWLLLTRVQVSHRTRELRSTAHRFQALTENAYEMITVLDPTGRVLYSSRGLERILGWKADERAGENVFELIHPDDQRNVRRVFAEVVAKPASTRVLEFRARTREGSWRTLSAITQNRMDDEAIGGVVVNSRDVTDQQALEHQLLQSKKLEAIGRVAGGIAHDFNNLMTVVRGHAEMLLDGDRGNAELDEGLREIAAATDRASALTAQLLAFSRRQMLHPRVVDPADVLRGMESLLRRLIGEDVAMEFVLEPNAGRVLADPTQLEQVVMNLAVNARDAMPDGGRLVIGVSRATLEQSPTNVGIKAGEYVVLTVSDTGIGIEPDALEHIFDPFFTTKPDGAGTGLGLATVYGIVRQSGGHIRVASDVGGTTFRIWLPRTEEEAAVPAPAPAPVPAAPARGTVLVAEDEDALRTMAARMLRRAGYDVITAADGAEALVLLESSAAIDLLLTDVVMPRIGGRELAERAALLRPGIRILYMSGYTDDDMLRRGVIAEGRNFLAKPFSAAQLVARVAAVLADATDEEAAVRP